MQDDTTATWPARLNPFRNGTPEQARSGRLAVLLAGTVATAGLTYDILYLALHMWLPAATVGAAALTCLAVMYGFRRWPNTTGVAHVLSGAAYTALLGVTWSTGGIESVALGWMLIVPLIGALLAGRRVGISWVGAVLVWFSVLYGVELSGYSVHNDMPAEFRSLFDYVVPVGLVLCVFAFVWSYELSREEAMERLHEARIEADQGHAHARAILDNVGEGLVLVRTDGRLGPARSQALERWFPRASECRSIWELLATRDPALAEQVETGWDQVGAGWLPVDVALEQLPTALRVDGQTLSLQWSEAGEAGDVMLVATDVTAQVQAEEERREQQEIVNILARLGRGRQQVLDFAAEARRIVDALVAGDGHEAQEKRWIHTLKGSSAVMGLGRLAEWLHALESTLAEECRSADEDERTALDALWSRFEDRISEVVGTDERGVVRVPSTELGDTIELVATGGRRDHVLARMEAWTWDDAQSRMEHLAEQAKRLADGMDKAIAVEVDVPGLRTPPSPPWSELWASLLHLVRNAVDHGVETDRSAVGKDGPATLTLRAHQVADVIRIEVHDDGAGIDWDAIEARARQRGHALESDTDRVQWLFRDGVTSRDEVSETSGRGVGTTAVLQAVKALDGSIEVESEPGRFTRFVITLPLVPVSAANERKQARTA